MFEAILRTERMLSLIRIKQTTHSTRCSAAHGSRVAAKPGHVVYVHDPPSYLDQSTCDQNMENAGKMLLRQIELRCDHAFLRGQCDHRLLGLRELWQLAQQVTADALSPGAQRIAFYVTDEMIQLLAQADEAAMDRARAALVQALAGTLDCTRVWEAWGCGNMTQEDFVPVNEDDDRVSEILEFTVEALLSPGVPNAD